MLALFDNIHASVMKRGIIMANWKPRSKVVGSNTSPASNFSTPDCKKPTWHPQSG